MTSLRQQYGTRERGISLAYLKLMGVKNVKGGIRFPCRSFDGRIYYRVTRFIPPRKIIKNGKPAEQRFRRPKDIPTELNFLPLTNGMTWKQVLADDSVPIIFAESDFKAAALAQYGYAVVTAGSVMGHRDSKSGTARCLDAFNWRGRDVYICFDNDFWFNAGVQDGLFDLGQELIDRGTKSVNVVLLPRPEYDPDTAEPIKKGIDDLTKEIADEGEDVEDWFEALDSKAITDPMFANWGKHRPQPRRNVVASLDFSKRPLSILTQAPPERSYVIAPWVGENHLAIMTMAGGGGKGFIELSLAMHIAIGKAWFGMPVKKGRVVLLCLEDSMEEVDRRMHDIVGQYAFQRKLGPVQRDELHNQILENVRYVSLEGEELHLITEENRVIVRTPAVTQLTQKIKPLKPLLIIPDPLTLLHALNENDNSVGSATISALSAIRKECKSAMLVMAHISKQAEKSATPSASALRGASSLSTGARSVIHAEVLDVEKAMGTFIVDQKDALDRFALLTHVKCNYGRKADPLYIVRGPNGVWGPLIETEYPFKTNKDGFANWISAVKKWLAKNDKTIFSKREVTQSQLKSISEVGQPKATEYFESALENDVLRKLSKAEMKERKVQGGGDRYCFMDIEK